MLVNRRTRVALAGLALNITYGSSGRLGELGSPGRMTFDQNIAATSGTRQLFLFD